MDKFLKIVLFLIVIILCGCTLNISKITYADFNEYFSSDEYTIVDNTEKYDIEIRKFIEAGDGNIQYFYIEFDSEKSATDYLERNYKDYKIKNYKNYSYIKNTKNGYMKLYKVSNTILIAQTSDKKYKSKLNKTLKKLGY